MYNVLLHCDSYILAELDIMKKIYNFHDDEWVMWHNYLAEFETDVSYFHSHQLFSMLDTWCGSSWDPYWTDRPDAISC